jgi:NAD(P)-dependent dehydrogenase (short-subunit alcohol dehydrogenase family)
MRTIERGIAVPLLTMLLICAGMIIAGRVEAQDTEQRVAADIGGGRAVLVTGASSGIGRTTTEHLAANGFFVYAGARKQADLDALNELENVQAIRLDVNIQEEIDAAVETVRAEGRGLYAVINNAGVVILAPLVEVSEEDLAFQMNVNVFGPYRVTKAFAPMLIESQGRVATTGSISGILTWTFGGPYTMSKHAIEAFTDVLAAELAPFGVKVSVIEPGNYNSRIVDNMMARVEEAGYSTEGSLYKEQLDRVFGGFADRDQEKNPDEVADAFLRALTDEEPLRRYMTVPNEREAELTIRAHIRRLVQLNEGQAYEFDRERLIQMLDEAMGPADGE